jgi:hypothetical protein
MIMKKILFPLFMAGILLSMVYSTSCRREDSVNVNQDRIYTHYLLEYDANENQTIARATFRMGGQYDSKLKLSEGSSITFNNVEMDFSGVYAYYQNEMEGFTESGTFRFTDLDGNQYANSISVLSAELPDSLPDIQKGAMYQIEWEGLSLGPNEVISLSIDGPADSDTETFTVSAEGATSISLSSSETERLNPGASIIKLERSYETNDVDAPEVGGKMETVYTSSSEGLDVVE